MNEEMDKELFGVFLGDAAKLSKALGDGLLALMDNLTDQERLVSLVRLAHSLKGAGSSVVTAESFPELTPLVEMAQLMETCFNAAKNGRLTVNARDIGDFLEGVGHVSALAETPIEELREWLVSRAQIFRELTARYAEIEKGRVLPEPPKTEQKPKTEAPKETPAATQKTVQRQPGAELSDKSLLGLFKIEAETHAHILLEDLLKVEADPSAASDLLPELMRAAHSLKGASGIVQLNQHVELAHAMENCFVETMEGRITLTENNIDLLLAGADLFGMFPSIPESEIPERAAKQKDKILELVRIFNSLKDGLEAPASLRAPREIKTPEQEAAESLSKESFVRVGADKMDRLLALAGEAVVSARRMRSLETGLLSLKGKLAGNVTEEVFNDLNLLYTELSDFLLKSDNFSSSLYNEVFACRIRPFEDGVGGFPRMVRDVSKRLGKKVRLEIKGRRTDVDRDILEKLEAPLNHILRNAIDHGMESPEERLKAGKPETGLIELSAYHWAGSLNVKVSDDGRGINIATIREKVVQRNLATAEMVKGMSDAEVLEFLFLPGFSTAEVVTEISGRGVGLDVVQNMVQQVRGSVRIETHPGKGTCFHLQLPVTLSVIPAIIALIGGEGYALPLVRVERLVRIKRDEIHSLSSHQFIRYDGANIGLISARELLGLPMRDLEDEEIPVVVVGDRSSQYAMVVDSFVGEREIVVRPLDGRLGKIGFVNAASIADDGTPLLILDIDDMIRAIDSLLKGGSLHKLRNSELKTHGRKRALVADDSITVRELERNLLSNEGYDVDVAVDGAEAWNAVRLGEYDIVVTDVDMPRMNGFELVERMKANDRLKGLPVVIVSYKDREEDKIRGVEVGADYYLTKGSFHDNSFIQAVTDLTGGALK